LPAQRAGIPQVAKFSLPGGSDNLNMFYYVYVVQSQKTSELYTGFSADLKIRLITHNKGLVYSTKSAVPWELIFYEAYRHADDAKRREKYLKTSQGSRLLKRMLKEYFYSKKLASSM
jgi:putative endonuclease